MKRKLVEFLVFLFCFILIAIMGLSNSFADSNANWFPINTWDGESFTSLTQLRNWDKSAEDFHDGVSTLSQKDITAYGSGFVPSESSLETTYPGYDIPFSAITSGATDQYVVFPKAYKFNGQFYDAKLYLTNKYSTQNDGTIQLRFKNADRNIFIGYKNSGAADAQRNVKFNLRLFKAGTSQEILLSDFYYQLMDLDNGESIGLPKIVYSGDPVDEPTCYRYSDTTADIIGNVYHNDTALYSQTTMTSGSNFRLKFPTYNQGIEFAVGFTKGTSDSGMQVDLLAKGSKIVYSNKDGGAVVPADSYFCPEGISLAQAAVKLENFEPKTGYYIAGLEYEGRYYNIHDSADMNLLKDKIPTADQIINIVTEPRTCTTTHTVTNGTNIQSGDRANYEITVQNTTKDSGVASDTSENFLLTETLPNCFDYSTAEAFGSNCTATVDQNTGILTITAPNLPCGQNATVNINATIKNGASKGEYSVSPMPVSANMTELNKPFVMPKYATVNVVVPKLSATKLVNGQAKSPVKQGTNATYTFQVSNIGDPESHLDNVVIADTDLPVGVTIDTSTMTLDGRKVVPTQIGDRGQFKIDVGTLGAGETKVLEVKTSAIAGTAGEMTNRMQVTTKQGQTAESAATIAPVFQIDTAVSKGKITSPVADISWNSTKTIYYEPNDGYELDTVKVNGEFVDKDSHKNSYTFSNIQKNNSIEVIYKKAGLSITKIATGARAFDGYFQKDDVITYKLVGGVVGDASASNVVISDLVPAGLEYISATSDKGKTTYSGGKVYIEVDKLAPYEKINAEVKCRVTAKSGALTNTATIDATGFDEDSADAIVEIVEPKAEMTKTVDKETCYKTDNLSYSINIRTTEENSFLDGVTLTDDNMSKGLVVDADSIHSSKPATLTQVSGGFKVQFSDMIKYGENVYVTFNAKIHNDKVDAGTLQNTAKLSTTQTDDIFDTASTTLKYRIETSAHKGIIDESGEASYGDDYQVKYAPYNENFVLHSIKVDGVEVDKDAYKDSFNFENVKDDHRIDVEYYTRPAINVKKTVDKEKAQIGDTLNYSVNIATTQSGTTHEDLTNVFVTDVVPSSLEITGVTTNDLGAKVVTSGQTVTYTNPRISAQSPGGQGQFIIETKIKTDSAIEGTDIVNVATGKDDFSLEPSESNEVKTYVLKPQLEITKTFEDDSYNVADQVNFDITLKNIGDENSRIDQLEVQDQDMSYGLELTRVTSDNQSMNISMSNQGFTGRYNKPLTDETVVIHGTGRLEAAKVTSKDLNNTCDATFLYHGKTSATDRSNITTNLETTAVNGTITPSETGIDFGQTRKVEYQGDEGYRLHQIFVDGTEIRPEDNPSYYTFTMNDNHSIKVVYEKLPTLSVEKKAEQDYYQTGEEVIYHITGKNESEGSYDTNVTIRDTVPDTLKVTEAKSSMGKVQVQGNDVECIVDKLTDQDNLELIIKATVKEDTQVGAIENIATISGDYSKEQGSAKCVIQVVNPSLSISKTTDKEIYHKGDVIHYEIAVANIIPNTYDQDVTVADIDMSRGIEVHKDSIRSTKGTVEPQDRGFIVRDVTLDAQEKVTIAFDAEVNNSEIQTSDLLNTAKAKGKWSKEVENSKPIKFFYTIETSIENGIITPRIDNMEPGQNQEIIYTPNEGYYVAEVEVDGQQVSPVDYRDGFNFENVRDDHAIHVVCKRMPDLTISNNTDKTKYNQGDLVNYIVKLRQGVDGAVSSNVVLKDVFGQNGYVDLDMESIRVLFNDWDITGQCVITKDENGFTCITGRDISWEDGITVTFNGKAIQPIDKLDNIATGICDENLIVGKKPPVATVSIAIPVVTPEKPAPKDAELNETSTTIPAEVQAPVPKPDSPVTGDNATGNIARIFVSALLLIALIVIFLCRRKEK